MHFEDLNLRRFFIKIQKDVVPLIKADHETEEQQATKGLTALFLAAKAGTPPDEAVDYVVDGSNDFGIDGLYFNSATQTLYIVQTKFRSNQDKTLPLGEALKFQNGIDRLLRGDLDGASQKLKHAYKLVEPGLTDINSRISICIATTSKKSLEPNVEQAFLDFCHRKNDIDTTFSFYYSPFDQCFQMAKFFSPEKTKDIDIHIHSFGRLKQPYKAFFGFVSGEAVAEWVRFHGNSLFEQNVRFTLQNTDVNENIFDTIKQAPSKFWYFNNGITAIASDVNVSAQDTDPKYLRATSMSIVNGAQTAGMLARAVDEGVPVEAVKVQFRVISLAGAEPGFDEAVTRANNTQNELNALDFVSLDPRQDILRTELAGLGFNYVFKRGEDVISDLPKIEVKDVAVALACAADDIAISVQAKRYVSGLWSSIKAPPYTIIFHDGLKGEDVVKIWKAYTVCENQVKLSKQGLLRENALILTHGDRFIAHCTFQFCKKKSIPLSDDDAVAAVAEEAAARLPSIFAERTSAYPATAFKNQKTQEELRDALLQKMTAAFAK